MIHFKLENFPFFVSGNCLWNSEVNHEIFKYQWFCLRLRGHVLERSELTIQGHCMLGFKVMNEMIFCHAMVACVRKNQGLTCCGAELPYPPPLLKEWGLKKTPGCAWKYFKVPVSYTRMTGMTWIFQDLSSRLQELFQGQGHDQKTRLSWPLQADLSQVRCRRQGEREIHLSSLARSERRDTGSLWG